MATDTTPVKIQLEGQKKSVMVCFDQVVTSEIMDIFKEALADGYYLSAVSEKGPQTHPETGLVIDNKRGNLRVLEFSKLP